MSDFNTNISASTFQQCDGTNFSTAGLDATYKIGKGSVGAYTGIGTNFENNTTGAIVDFKGSMPYGKNIGGGFRIRNNINSKSQTVQFRVQPFTTTIPINKNTNFYTTPYVATKLDYQNGKATTTCGIFSGISKKIGKVKAFVEGQLYDISKINKNTTSVNAGISIPLD